MAPADKKIPLTEDNPKADFVGLFGILDFGRFLFKWAICLICDIVV